MLTDYRSFLFGDKNNSIFRAQYVMAKYRNLGMPNRLLDIGCGSGELLRIAVGAGVAEVCGVDGIQDAIDQCKDIVGQFHEVDLNTQSLPLENDSFDGVVCLEVLEHLYAPQNVLSEMYRVVECGHWAIISVPNPYTYSMRIRVMFGGTISDPTIIGGHIKFFRMNDLREMCSRAGFQDIQLCGLAYPTAYKKSHRLASWLVKHWPSIFATWFFACCKKPQNSE